MAKFLKITDVCEALAVSRAEIYRLMERGRLPRPIAISAGARGVRWLEDDVNRYIERRVAESRGAQTQPAA